VGMVNESDVALASATGASIVAFHVKAEPNALLLAQKNGVILRNYDIIYKLLESLEEIAQGAREVKMVRTKIGEAVVRQLFNIKGLGVIAGCYVKEGRFSRDGSVVVWRGKQKVGEGKIKSLQREKKTVKEVSAGYECGFLVEGFDQWEIDDRAECFIEVAQQPK
ncbi:MAG TPA: translation initiation factor IF-2, partial [Candidatus Limnocylindria bacterium]|nr:translation initiation factor IF-2 [Candidatus Limnocylindria bacterium]